jgi:hypothetical protein
MGIGGRRICLYALPAAIELDLQLIKDNIEIGMKQEVSQVLFCSHNKEVHLCPQLL